MRFVGVRCPQCGAVLCEIHSGYVRVKCVSCRVLVEVSGVATGTVRARVDGKPPARVVS
jgi:phage FluMu protein Com